VSPGRPEPGAPVPGVILPPCPRVGPSPECPLRECPFQEVPAPDSEIERSPDRPAGRRSAGRPSGSGSGKGPAGARRGGPARIRQASVRRRKEAAGAAVTGRGGPRGLSPTSGFRSGDRSGGPGFRVRPGEAPSGSGPERGGRRAAAPGAGRDRRQGRRAPWRARHRGGPHGGPEGSRDRSGAGGAGDAREGGMCQAGGPGGGSPGERLPSPEIFEAVPAGGRDGDGGLSGREGPFVHTDLVQPGSGGNPLVPYGPGVAGDFPVPPRSRGCGHPSGQKKAPEGRSCPPHLSIRTLDGGGGVMGKGSGPNSPGPLDWVSLAYSPGIFKPRGIGRSRPLGPPPGWRQRQDSAGHPYAVDRSAGPSPEPGARTLRRDRPAGRERHPPREYFPLPSARPARNLQVRSGTLRTATGR
jgi:hypothetical protein